eukprot:scaffold71_cov247-Pinguiococcus_pyrenoidosus.AAC.5
MYAMSGWSPSGTMLEMRLKPYFLHSLLRMRFTIVRRWLLRSFSAVHVISAVTVIDKRRSMSFGGQAPMQTRTKARTAFATSRAPPFSKGKEISSRLGTMAQTSLASSAVRDSGRGPDKSGEAQSGRGQHPRRPRRQAPGHVQDELPDISAAASEACEELIGCRACLAVGVLGADHRLGHQLRQKLGVRCIRLRRQVLRQHLQALQPLRSGAGTDRQERRGHQPHKLGELVGLLTYHRPEVGQPHSQQLVAALLQRRSNVDAN